MGAPIKASIVIPTHNGARKIHNLLDALLNQSCEDVEIIIVVDGSRDDTENVLKAYQKIFEHFKIVSQKNGGRSVARNNGARESSSELLIFYDDDMMPFPDSIQKHLDFQSSKSCILCGDPVEIFDKRKTDIQNYKAWLTAIWTGKYAEGTTRMRRDHLFFTASNCSIPKNIFWQLNGFDEHLTDAEDYELACRAIEQEIPVYYDKGNKALHNENITCRSYIRRLREYSDAQTKIVRYYPEHNTTKSNMTSVRKIIYKFFAFPFWVRLIDTGFFVFVFPRPLRYRLYSIIIHALANEHARVLL
ncbi:MAG: glycosyltransferase [Cyclobacteriaceae bacterium]